MAITNSCAAGKDMPRTNIQSKHISFGFVKSVNFKEQRELTGLLLMTDISAIRNS